MLSKPKRIIKEILHSYSFESLALEINESTSQEFLNKCVLKIIKKANAKKDHDVMCILHFNRIIY